MMRDTTHEVATQRSDFYWKGEAMPTWSQKNGDSLLYLAATLHSGHDALEVIRLLVNAGCNPRELNSASETPLHIAVVDYL